MIRDYTKEQYDALTDAQRREVLANTPKAVQEEWFLCRENNALHWANIGGFFVKLVIWGFVLMFLGIFVVAVMNDWPEYVRWIFTHLSQEQMQWMDAHLPHWLLSAMEDVIKAAIERLK